MITNVLIRKIACFGNEHGASFKPTQINYLYGANGSGKTTLSNILSNCGICPECELRWNGGIQHKVLVYNRKFVEDNYEQSDEMRGIFTLGKESKEIQKRIRELKKQIDEKQDVISKNNAVIEREKQKTNEAVTEFTEKCWNVHKKYEVVFVRAFEGYRGAKAKFREKVQNEYRSNRETVLGYSELVDKAKEILNSDASTYDNIDNVNIADFQAIENHPVFKVRIVGKEDVSISSMIQKLNNSDWVRQGVSYYQNNNQYCPFCQQYTSEEFRRSLEDYFDETYVKQTQTLSAASQRYVNEVNALIDSMEKILLLDHPCIPAEELRSALQRIEVVKRSNMLRLEKKGKEPTALIELESIQELVEALRIHLADARAKTQIHNAMIANLHTEKASLIACVWAYVIDELRLDHGTYESKLAGCDKAIRAITEKNRALEIEIEAMNREIQSAERSVSSVQPTIDEINKMLAGFGFVNFNLAIGERTGTYRVVRLNGEDAKRTLSEGEKTFITFLYYYYLTRGSHEASEVTSDKILVVDDPISSLDSSILYVVSSLVRNLIQECRLGTNGIKQVFVLTHNVYFHKEVTYRRNSDKTAGDSYWIIRRRGESAEIVRFEQNPIRTSYDLLWQEIRDNTRINHTTICNTLRRILEYYFKILGRTNTDDIVKKYEGEQRVICSTLLSWINDGSHDVNDDLYVMIDEETVDKYLMVFRGIFESEGHLEHYNMMMREP